MNISSFCRLAVIGIFSLVSLSAVAGTFVYVDHWPSGDGEETSTECKVPAGTTAVIATADDVARVSRLTGLEIEEGATVSYTAQADLVLAADVSGEGFFNGSDSGELTLSGDNSGLISPGRFSVNGTAIVVADPAGLGGRNTGAALLTATDATAHKASITFNMNSAGVFTNEVALTVGRKDYKFIASPHTGRIVQHNNFEKTVSGNICIDGTLEFYECFVKSANYMYAKAVDKNRPAHLWFSGKCTYSFSNLLFLYGSGSERELTVHFNGTSAFNADPCFIYGICECEDALKDRHIAPWRFYTTFDLNGYDQHIRGFNDVQVQTDKTRVITSSRPATLTTTYYSDYYSTIHHWPIFTGEVSYCHDNQGTEYIAKHVSTTTNLLEVAQGKVVLEDGAGWSGDVKVRSGAILELSSVRAMTGGNRRLTVEAEGTLILKSGVVCKVLSANIAGTELAAGYDYTVAWLKGEGLPVDGDSNAYISVVRLAEWEGWPTEPGARAFIPQDVTVTVEEADLGAISALGEIHVSDGGKVVFCELPEGFELAADVTGTGTIEFYDSERIIVNGDSSELLSPGAYFFSNSCVVVSNRFGLGSSATGPCTVYFGDKIDALRFGGEGLTNDVPLQVYQGTGAENLVLGPDNAEETLVLNGGYLVMNDADIYIYLRNNIVFGGVFGFEKNKYHRIYALTDPVVLRFEKSSGFKGDKMLMFGNIQMHADWENPARIYYISLFAPRNNSLPPSMKLYGENLLSGITGYIMGLGTFDLNGYNQTVPRITRQHGSPLKITSDKPAVLTMVKDPAEPNWDIGINTEFSGAAGFQYASTASNELTGAYCDTTGPLTVSSGVLRVTGTSGWGGTNVTVRGDARLIVSEASAARMFGDRKVLGRSTTTHLEIENGGVLKLEGGVATVRSFSYGGAMQPAGVYTKDGGVGIEGDGVLRVRSSCRHEPGFIILCR